MYNTSYMEKKVQKGDGEESEVFKAFSSLRRSALQKRRDELILAELESASPREVAYIFNVSPQLVSYIKKIN